MGDIELAAAVGIGLETGDDVTDRRKPDPKIYRRLLAVATANGALVATAPCPSNKRWLLNFARYSDIAAAWTLYVGPPPAGGAANARHIDFLAHAAIGAQLVAIGGNVIIYPGESIYTWAASNTPVALICDVEE